MTDDTVLRFNLPAVWREKLAADLEGGLISSDGGLVLLRETGLHLSLTDMLVVCILDWRDPALVVDRLSALLRFCMFAIFCR